LWGRYSLHTTLCTWRPNVSRIIFSIVIYNYQEVFFGAIDGELRRATSQVVAAQEALSTVRYFLAPSLTQAWGGNITMSSPISFRFCIVFYLSVFSLCLLVFSFCLLVLFLKNSKTHKK
jgi:hypothetical protein